MSRALAFAISMLCCALSWADPWDSDSIASIFSHRELDPVEGVWQMPADGARMLIERSSATTYRIVLLDSPRLDIMPGVVIGSATATAVKGKYDATLDRKALADRRVKTVHAILVVGDDGMMRIEPYTQGKKLNLRRWLPYLLRVVDDNDTRPMGIDGAMRAYPGGPNSKPCL